MFFAIGFETTKVLNAETANQRFFTDNFSLFCVKYHKKEYFTALTFTLYISIFVTVFIYKDSGLGCTQSVKIRRPAVFV